MEKEIYVRKKEIGCVILAAGKSVRFGKNKLTEPLGGVPVLARTLSALPKETFTRICAVVSSDGAEEIARRAEVPFVRYAGGPLSQSIRMGLEAMKGLDGCMFLNGDQPLIRTESIRRLLDAFSAHSDAVYRLSFGGVQASPAVFPAALFDALLDLKGEQGGMAAARNTNAAVCPVEAEGEEELWDMDTADCLERAAAFLAQNAGQRR